MPGPWNASSERKLLLCIIGLHAKLKWDVIAPLMGEEFTEEACRQKYYKLKKESEKLAGTAPPGATHVKNEANADGGLAAPAPARGRKRKVENEEDAKPSDSPKRVRKTPIAPLGHRQSGNRGPVRDEGGTHWTSDDEGLSSKDVALTQDIN